MSGIISDSFMLKNKSVFIFRKLGVWNMGISETETVIIFNIDIDIR